MRDDFYKTVNKGFLWVPVFLGFGCGVYFLLPFEPDVVFTSLLVFICAIILFFYRPFWLAAIFLLFFGIMISTVRTEYVYAPVLTQKFSNVFIKGMIEYVEIIGDGKKTRFILKNPVIEGVEKKNSPNFIRMTVRGKHDFKIGQAIYGFGFVAPPNPPLVAGGFDFQRYSFFKRIGGYGYFFGKPEIDWEEYNQEGFKSYIYEIRDRVEKRIIESGYDGASLFSVLMTGKKGSMNEDDIDAMRDSGLAHMLAISGMHVGMMSGIVFYFLRLFLAFIPYIALRFDIKKIAAIASILTAVSYMYFSGAAIPAQRAALMVSIVMLAVMLNRSPISMRLVAFCAVFILVISPESIVMASFQLSFSAVIGLVLFWGNYGSVWWRYLSNKGVVVRIGGYLLGIAVTSLVAWIFTAPFVLYHFQSLSLVSLPANVLAMPLLGGIVMPMVLLSYLLMGFGLEEFAIRIGCFGADLIINVASYFSDFENSVFNYGDFDFICLILVVIAFICAYLFVGRLKYISLIPIISLIPYIYLNSANIKVYFSGNGEYLLACVKGEGCFTDKVKGGKFVFKSWAQDFGYNHKNITNFSDISEGKVISCDDMGCRIDGATKISIVFENLVIEQECSWADYIIVRGNGGVKCNGKIIDLEKIKGAGFIEVNRFNNSLVKVNDVRANRPWVIKDSVM